MLSVTISGPSQSKQFEHPHGPLEFGRGPQREVRRVTLEDPYASRDHIRVEELPSGRVRIENLSTSKAVPLGEGPALATGTSCVFSLPVRLTIGRTLVTLGRDDPGPDPEAASLLTISAPVRGGLSVRDARPLESLGEVPPPEMLAQWLERVIALQHSAAGGPEFHGHAARALVELVGLDVGMVLLCQDGTWSVAAAHAVDDKCDLRYSRTLIAKIVADRRTFYQDPGLIGDHAMSLRGIDAVVASPVFGVRDEVAGALYGSRRFRGRGPVAIRPLQAQVVQLLAAAVGANQARTTAIRTRVQFEQFFSPELVHELERNPTLLEGRSQEVTILASDLRGFTRLSERLGAETTCRVVRDMMERLSERIVEQGGAIVDYAGDGILAMWNAPVAQEDHAVRACRAALAMQSELPGLNARWQSVVGDPLRLGIGLNTGPALVGNTGSSRKLKYGPHGHTVNLASRVQDATKKLGVPVLVSPATQERVAGTFLTQLAGTVELAGVQAPVTLHQLLGEGKATAH